METQTLLTILSDQREEFQAKELEGLCPREEERLLFGYAPDF